MQDEFRFAPSGLRQTPVQFDLVPAGEQFRFLFRQAAAHRKIRAGEKKAFGIIGRRLRQRFAVGAGGLLRHAVSGLLARNIAPLDLQNTSSRPDNAGRAPNSEQKQVKDRGHERLLTTKTPEKKAFWAVSISSWTANAWPESCG